MLRRRRSLAFVTRPRVVFPSTDPVSRTTRPPIARRHVRRNQILRRSRRPRPRSLFHVVFPTRRARRRLASDHRPEGHLAPAPAVIARALVHGLPFLRVRVLVPPRERPSLERFFGFFAAATRERVFVLRVGVGVGARVVVASSIPHAEDAVEISRREAPGRGGRRFRGVRAEPGARGVVPAFDGPARLLSPSAELPSLTSKRDALVVVKA